MLLPKIVVRCCSRQTMLVGLLLTFAPTPFLAKARAVEWYPLFDGLTLQGWTTLDGKPVTRGWEVVDGMMHLNVAEGRGGEIVTDRDYGDFEFLFEWKIAARGNSGIKYRVRPYNGAWLGCEYQMIDDHELRGLRPNQLTASLYDLYPPRAPRELYPAGEFNRGRIVVQGNCIEHWMNGRLVVQAEVGSATWQERIAASKFSDREGFGANRLGRIMLTDHNTEVWYRNLFLRPLPSPERCRVIRTSVECAYPVSTAR